MAEFPDERQLVLRARSQLDQWTKSARREAYAELFEGDDPLLSTEEVQLLDALDSELERQGGDGVWGTEQYGIHTGDLKFGYLTRSGLRVPPTDHQGFRPPWGRRSQRRDRRTT